MSTRRFTTSLAIACLAWTASAQSPEGPATDAEPAPKAPEALAPSVSPGALGSATAVRPVAWATDVWSIGARVEPSAVSTGALASAEWLELGPLPAGAGRRGSVAREDLDAAGTAAPVAYDALPGGIVLGLVARPDVAFAEPRIELRAGRLFVVDGELPRALPRADARFLSACLAFATSGRADDAACDILVDGSVVLAPEFVDTQAGVALVDGDRLPHARLAGLWNTKSLLLDRDARLSLDAATGELRPTAELEARFCKPGAFTTGGAAVWVEAQPVEGVLRIELAETARIAAWVAFFRWAQQVDPAGTARVADELAWSELELGGTPTPRRVEPRSVDLAYPYFAPSRTPSSVPDWMRAQRASLSANDAR